MEKDHWKCTSGPPDSGLLHDKISLMWGKIKDLVDVLQAEMDKHRSEPTILKCNLNKHLEALANSKVRCFMGLYGATASLP